VAVFALRLIVAILAALALADCGNMHACTSDGVPCNEASTRPLSAQSSGGASSPPAPLFPTAVAANAPFVPPAFDEPAAAPSPEPPPDGPRPAATVTETTNPAAAPDEEEGGRHHGRHGRHGRHHSSGGSHHRRHH
jgi:hypothetical protein